MTPTKTTTGQPAKLPGVRRAQRVRFGYREVKMVRPICREGCQDGAGPDWYLDCPHDPYVTTRPRTTKVPIYSEPHEDGSRTLQGVEERVSYEVIPNIVGVAVNMQINSGLGIEKARRKGWIDLGELQTEAFPHGIAPMCEYRGCRWQDDLQEFKNGTYCREIEARTLALMATGPNGDLLYGAQEVSNEGKRAVQLSRVVV